ncbi:MULTISPECIES: TIGR04500 family putative peptide maturation system protein [Streptosporangium]|uniref:Peptide maturation system protein n=1 Tax=Streptosporangium brasiliense TaxID=47480 RepID=A0ABT9R4U7_9ACTN|nr:TIGR04500 family putative peptide maturation system protein [Streptosporangium brasiliense]MDP9863455.1 putative peptide maturation system protein [Streptosporangium brasiliense]
MSTDQSAFPSPTGPAPAGAAPAHAAFATDLADAVTLLRGLPTSRDTVDDAHRCVRGWGAQRPWLRAQLVVDGPPGTTRVGYDLLLEHPEGGSVALSAETADGIPWLVDHSTHWAAGQVLSVDGTGLSVPAALSAIRALGTRDRQLHERLVDRCILLGEVEDDTEPLTVAETQQAADEFRRRRGLSSRAQTLDWLAETGMSEEAFWNHVKTQARTARVRGRFAGEPARRHLAEHPEEFTLRRAAWVTGPRPEELRALVDGPVTEFVSRAATALVSAPGAGSPTVRRDGGRGTHLQAAAMLTSRLPEPLRTVPGGTAIGPVPYKGGHLAGVVYEVLPPDPGAAEVLDAARDAAFQAWLDERRRTSDIRWFWL